MEKTDKKEFVKVLVAHSNQQIRATLSYLFKKREYFVVCVDTAKEAFEMLPKYPFHFVIADAGLPDMSGKALLEKIRKMNFKINCIIMDGLSPKTGVANNGNNEPKPLSLEEVIAIFSKKEAD